MFYSFSVFYLLWLSNLTTAFLVDPKTPVGFSTALTHTTTLTTQQTVQFDKIITNVGKAYNVQTGKFTAPFKGLYMISATIFDFYHSSLTAEIVQNANSLVDLFSDGSGHQNSAMTQTLVLALNKEDQVWIRSKTDGGKLSGASGQPTGVFNTFSGYLLQYME